VATVGPALLVARAGELGLEHRARGTAPWVRWCPWRVRGDTNPRPFPLSPGHAHTSPGPTHTSRISCVPLAELVE